MKTLTLKQEGTTTAHPVLMKAMVQTLLVHKKRTLSVDIPTTVRKNRFTNLHLSVLPLLATERVYRPSLILSIRSKSSWRSSKGMSVAVQ